MKKQGVITAIVASVAAMTGTYLWYEKQSSNKEVMARVEQGQVGQTEENMTFAMMKSDNLTDISEGIRISMMFKEEPKRTQAIREFERLIEHPDADIRAAALLGLFRLDSPSLNDAIRRVKYDREGVVANSLQIITTPKSRVSSKSRPQRGD